MNQFLRMLAWVVAWTVFPAMAVELVGKPDVSVSGQEVTLRWKTDVACRTRLVYGVAGVAAEQRSKVEGAVTATHEVVLNNLKAGADYEYSLGSAKVLFFDGQFKTGPATAVQPPSPPAAAPARKSLLEKVTGVFSAEKKSPASEVRPVTQARAPPTHQTWGRMDSLQDHFVRHGADFQSKSADDYAAGAWRFLQRAKAGELLMKWDDADSTLRVFDSKTRDFAAYNRAGKTKTYFRPGNPAYWQRQPGRPIKAAELPF